MWRGTARGGRNSTVLTAAAALGVVALTVSAIWLLFNSGNAVAVGVPVAASSSARSDCSAMNAALPQTVDSQGRRGTDPSSPLTAAWGDPAITLRCGVPEPEVLRPGSKTYDPSADEAYVDGVAWLIEKAANGNGYRFTAAQRAVYIEVDVPSAYSPETSALTDFASAVTSTVPRDTGGLGADVPPLPTGQASATATASASAKP